MMKDITYVDFPLTTMFVSYAFTSKLGTNLKETKNDLPIVGIKKTGVHCGHLFQNNDYSMIKWKQRDNP